MDDFQESVMVALFPTTSDWCHIELPHLTLIYAGEIPDLPLSLKNTLAKSSLMMALACKSLTLEVLDLELFGEDENIEVLTFTTSPQLLAMRDILDEWDGSEYPFRPHVTVGPIGSFSGKIPETISFDKIAVCWGKEILEFKLV